MKAILVTDMPESCSQCEIFNFSDLTCLGCKVNFKDVGKVQSWCPLKPMLEKKDVDKYQTNFSRGWDEGYNYCIDELLGVEDND